MIFFSHLNENFYLSSHILTITNAQTAFHHCTFQVITAHVVHHCTLKQALRSTSPSFPWRYWLN